MCGLCAVRKRKRSNPSDVLCRSLRYLVDLQGFHICRPFYSLIFIIECCITPTVPQCNIVSSFSVFIDRSLLITLPAHIDFYIQKYRARIWYFICLLGGSSMKAEMPCNLTFLSSHQLFWYF